MVLLGPLLFLLLAPSASAQQSPQSSASPTANATSTRASNATSPNVTSILTSIPVTRTSVTAGSTVQITTFIPTTVLSTIAQPNNTATPTTNATATSTPTQSSGPMLDTRLDPAFGVLGALLVLTGLPSAFLGHKNRWSSFFLTGFYTLALVCLALILKFGVLVAIHPPNQTLRGLFVLACGVAGIAGGGVTIFFWQQAKYFIGAWGGFSIGLWVQCFRDGGLIRPIGFRWILFIGCGAVGFVLCTIPKLHYHVLITGTAITGASAFILGVDCFTTAGLKEFYVYNLGFTTLFPKFAGIPFPLSQTMDVEIGLIAAVSLMGAAVQLRVLKVLKRKLAEINEEERKREALAEEKAVMRFDHVESDLTEWEKEHGKLSHAKHGSQVSGLPLMKDIDEAQPSTPTGDSTLGRPRPRTRSVLSELAMYDDPQGSRVRPLSRFSQNPGLLPAMNLGLGLDTELAGNLTDEEHIHMDPDLMKKEELLAEIQTIRKSIDALRSESDSNSGDSRRPSTSLRSRTFSAEGQLAPVQVSSSNLRPPRHGRDRVHSMDILSSFDNRMAEANMISRPASTPLREDDWDSYVRERKLFQPPSGPSAPIVTTLMTPVARPASTFIAVPDAVTEALARRRARESALEGGGVRSSRLMDEPNMDGRVSGSSSQTPLVDHLDAGQPRPQRRRSNSGGPMNILPPRPSAKAGAAHEATPTRTRTFEELVERHQQKMRTLQEPLSKREKEQADLAAARSRWERSKAVEKDVMAKKHAEKEAALAKKSKEEGKRARGEGHTRSASADKLAGVGGGGGTGGKRASTAKVQEWQRYQQQQLLQQQQQPQQEGEKEKDSKRGRAANQAVATEQGALPFPNTGSGSHPPRGASTGERRKSRGGVPRDPPR